MDIISWFLTWWIRGIITSFIITNVIPAILLYIPSPLRGYAKMILNKTLVIRIEGITITIGFGTIVGYLFFSSL